MNRPLAIALYTLSQRVSDLEIKYPEKLGIGYDETGKQLPDDQLMKPSPQLVDTLTGLEEKYYCSNLTASQRKLLDDNFMTSYGVRFFSIKERHEHRDNQILAALLAFVKEENTELRAVIGYLLHQRDKSVTAQTVSKMQKRLSKR